MVGRGAAEILEQLGLADERHAVACGKGERIFPKHAGRNTMAVVREGLVYLCAENERYARSIVGFFVPGEMMDAAMLLPLRHGVSYFMAKYPARLTVFSREELMQAVSARPQAAALLGERLAAMAQGWMWHDYMLQQRGIRQRLLAFFRREAERQGSRSLHLPLPQADLAEYLGVDRAAMARELTRMKQEGMISGARREWTLQEP